MEKYIYGFLAVYYVIINIVGFSLMYTDKKRARNGEWRISEASLFVAALLFGALGSTIGMWKFRHKTKHGYFVVGMPLILVAQILLVAFLLYYFMR